jgi:hypothetical protein
LTKKALFDRLFLMLTKFETIHLSGGFLMKKLILLSIILFTATSYSCEGIYTAKHKLIQKIIDSRLKKSLEESIITKLQFEGQLTNSNIQLSLNKAKNLLKLVLFKTTNEIDLQFNEQEIDEIILYKQGVCTIVLPGIDVLLNRLENILNINSVFIKKIIETENYWLIEKILRKNKS